MVRRTGVMYDPAHASEPDFISLVQEDYNLMRYRVMIEAAPEVAALLRMRTIVGHAVQGHGAFTNRAWYSNVTPYGICLALGWDPEHIMSRHQHYIDGVWSYIERILKDPKNPMLEFAKDHKGDPLCGLDIFSTTPVTNRIAFLKGFAAVGHMDDEHWRGLANKEYDCKLKRGACLAVNMEQLARQGIMLEDLAKSPLSPYLFSDLQRSRAISTDIERTTANMTNGYTLLERGCGLSDEGGICYAGKKWGVSGLLGGVAADYIDTMEKFSYDIFPEGQDLIFATAVEEELPRLGAQVSSAEKTSLIRCAATTDNMESPDSSQRYFSQRVNGHPTALELHVRMLQTRERDIKNLPIIPLSFKQIPSDRFYSDFLEKYYKN
jgi:hypothetical protein